MVRNILITGGNGFIGSNFLNHMVIKYPNVNFYNFDCNNYCSSTKNTSDLHDKPNYFAIENKIENKEVLLGVLTTYKIDTIIHFASHNHISNNFYNSLLYTNNTLSTHILLDCARLHNKIKRFIYISTDEVYGENNDYLGEEQAFLSATNQYATSAFSTANNAYTKANNALANTSGTTFGGELLSLAAAKEVLTRHVSQDICGNIADIGTELTSATRSIIELYNLENVIKLPGHESWTFLNWSNSSEFSSDEIKTLFAQETFKRGVLVLSTHNVTLAHNSKQRSKIIEVYSEVAGLLSDAISSGNLRELLEVKPLKPLFKVR
jgi:dTDP-4-dehydrorhamnose reductase